MNSAFNIPVFNTLYLYLPVNPLKDFGNTIIEQVGNRNLYRNQPGFIIIIVAH